MFWPTGQFRYERHTPETTLLYQLVECHWPESKAMLSAQGKQLPICVAPKLHLDSCLIYVVDIRMSVTYNCH